MVPVKAPTYGLSVQSTKYGCHPKKQRADYQDHISFQKEYTYYIGVMCLCISHILKHKEDNIFTSTRKTDVTFLCIEATINTIDYSSTIRSCDIKSRHTNKSTELHCAVDTLICIA